MNYSHLSQKERDHIYILKQEGLKNRAIANILKRHPATISREIKRNSTSIKKRYNNSPKKKKYYLPDRANEKYKQRRRDSKYTFPLKDPWTYRYVIKNLKTGLSPETISGVLKFKYNVSISHETIYLFIYSKRVKKLELWQYLRRAHKKRRKWNGRKGKRMRIPNRRDIKLRPKDVETRKVFGHWEGDSIIGIGKGAALHTEVERMSRKVFIRKKIRKTAKETKRVMINIYKSLPEQVRKTTTVDNGSEFTEHEDVTKETGVIVYCATPYRSCERGTNENTNGLIRWYFPKKTNFNEISEKEIQKIENILNNRPRKCLGYRTPNEVFHQLLSESCT